MVVSTSKLCGPAPSTADGRSIQKISEKKRLRWRLSPASLLAYFILIQLLVLLVALLYVYATGYIAYRTSNSLSLDVLLFPQLEFKKK